MSNPSEYILEREFNAPQALVWKAWTTPELISEWYGPGVETIIHKFDLTIDGVWQNEMKMGARSMRSLMQFKEIDAPNKLVWHHSDADENWQVCASSMMENWPLVLLTTVTFEALGDQTKVTLSQIPMGATAEEEACFANAMAGMSKGWGSGFAIMDTILEKLIG